MQRKWQEADRARDTESTADPIPEPEHVLPSNSERIRRRMVGAHSAKVRLQRRSTVAILNLGREKFHNLPLDSPRIEHCLRSRKCL